MFKTIFCVGVSFGIGGDMGVSLNPVFSNPALILPTFLSQNRTPAYAAYCDVLRAPHGQERRQRQRRYVVQVSDDLHLGAPRADEEGITRVKGLKLRNVGLR